MTKAPLRRARHIVIEDLNPRVEGDHYPVKRIAGEKVSVRATIFRDGHEILRAVVRRRRKGTKTYHESPMKVVNPGLDLWEGEFLVEENGRYLYTVEAWTDRYGSWVKDLAKRVDAGQKDVASEILEGVRLIRKVKAAARGADRERLDVLLADLEKKSQDPAAALALVSDEALIEAMIRLQKREDPVAHAPEIEIVADRPRARFGAWYEIFVRSQGTEPGQSGTFRDAERRLPDIKAMGFDVVYLAPIHPIGKTNRKGKNNSLVAGPDDPGSPWAIGNETGGHDAVEPAIGTLADFDRFVEVARRIDMEVALDFAIQASPDHPWVKRHPEWFYHRPDGTIKYAENPPKKYEDVYPLNFETTDQKALWEEMRRVLRFWIRRGVKIFRVDNPHTKPIPFWKWLIDEIQSEHPDVLFLSEAFTRPPMMKALGKTGFTQSYTYFTWRNTKAELKDYMTELTGTEMKDYYRPNFFANTPDILPVFLQEGGRPAFQIRLVLAATLSPAYGIYSGFELCENEALPGREEYRNSEKYEIKVRDWNAAGNIKDLIAKVNAARRDHPCLREFDNLRFFDTDNEQLLVYGKAAPDESELGMDAIVVAVNLDPLRVQAGTAAVPPEAIGLKPGDRYEVRDLLTGARYAWGERNYVRLDPASLPAHLLRVERRLK